MCVQVYAYLDNRIDVRSLLADSEMKVAALEQVAQLEDSLTQVSQHLTTVHCETLLLSSLQTV